MRRRTTIIVGGAAIVAVAAGAATALWRSGRPQEPQAPPIDLWSLAFPRPEGGVVRMSELRGRPLLVNFWATWCGPCVTEMPLLDRFARGEGGAKWQVLALAVDQVEPVRRFVAERSLTLPVGMAGHNGLELSRSFGNSRGGLPFTVAFDQGGRAVASKVGAVSADLLIAWAALLS